MQCDIACSDIHYDNTLVYVASWVVCTCNDTYLNIIIYIIYMYYIIYILYYINIYTCLYTMQSITEGFALKWLSLRIKLKTLKCKPSAEFGGNIGIFGLTPLHA